MEVIHISAEPYFTNCFLLVGNNGHAVAIDPAAPVARFVEALDERNAQLAYVFLTHGHFDHTAAVDELRNRTGAKVLLGEADAQLKDGNLFRITPDGYFTDGQAITVDDMEFSVIATPGHTPGSVCIRTGDLLFTGDTLFSEDCGRTDLKGGSAADMAASLKKLKYEVEGDPQVFPGHEEFTTLEKERRTNVCMGKL